MRIQDKMQKLAGDLRELLVDGKTFDGEIVGVGLTWNDGSSPLKQIVYSVNPDRFHVTEHVDLGKNKAYYINGEPVLSSTALGDNVTKSSLTEVGALEGLIVNGPANINDTVQVMNGKVVLGAPVFVNDGADLILSQGKVIVRNSNLVLSSNKDEERHTTIVLTPDGVISIGDLQSEPVQASVHGKLSVNVANPDPEVDLHVGGAIKYEGRVHRYNVAPPISGYHNIGDIIWNSQPRLEHYVGWVCIVAGNPGRWEPFGKIGNQ